MVVDDDDDVVKDKNRMKFGRRILVSGWVTDNSILGLIPSFSLGISNAIGMVWCSMIVLQ
jgi:hypothetical protein